MGKLPLACIICALSLLVELVRVHAHTIIVEAGMQ